MKQDSALLVIDVQNDFCPGGALPVADGDAVVPVLNAYIELFRAANLPVFASRDWHPPQSRHFKEGGGLWPVHCVRDTPGAEFHPGLKLPDQAVVISAGVGPDEEGYSSFEGAAPDGRVLYEVLKEAGVTGLYVGGLATDYCVKQTVLDALKRGFKVTLLIDAVKGIDVKEGDSQRAIDEMMEAGAEPVTLKDFRFR